MGGPHATRTTRLLAVLFTGAIAIAACGDDGNDRRGSGATSSTETTVVAGEPVTSLGTPVDRRGESIVEVVALDNVFVEPSLRIDVGTTVRWRNDGRAHHTIQAANDPAAVQFGADIVTLALGDEHDVTFTEPGRYLYFCNLHGNSTRGMIAQIVVGDGETPDPEPPPTEATVVEATDPSDAGEVIRVPGDEPTIQAAVDRANAGTLVLIAPGTYHEAVVVTRNDVVIRGEDRNTVVLDGRHELDNGIEILEADGVVVENLTVTRYTLNGLFWTGVEGYRASYVTATNNGYYGVYAFNSRSGIFEHSYASGGGDSGFYIGQCKPCDGVVRDVVAELNNVGFAGVNTTGVVIEDSTWRRNRAGIVIGSFDHELLPPQQADIVRNNVVEGSGDLAATAPLVRDLDVLYGIGVVVIGGLDNVIEDNTVRDSVRLGIAITPNPAIGINFWPAERNRVSRNTVTGSGEYDLGFVAVPDVGGNCFAGNTFATSAPLDLERAAPCDGEPSADIAAGAPDLAAYLDTSDVPPGTVTTENVLPGPQPNMPDALTAPARPADR